MTHMIREFMHSIDFAFFTFKTDRNVGELVLEIVLVVARMRKEEFISKT